MRLYLSSERMGARFEELVAFLGPGAKAAVVANATDFLPELARRIYTRTVFDPAAHFRKHGVEAFDLDLRAYFGRPRLLEDALAQVRLVFATGGNAFLLRRAMRQSGLDGILQRRVPQGEMVYGGWSAGSAVASPTLHGIELMDDPKVLAEGYDAEPVWEGLALIDFTFVPHFRSLHAESAAAERVAAWLTKDGRPFKAVRDGEVVVI